MIGFRAQTGISNVLSDWLDLARGLAAVEVLAFHSYQLMFMEKLPGEGYDPAMRAVYSILWAASANGPAAVLVFFVLSGYLVGGPALVRALRGQPNAVDYFSARLSRLYVVLLPALTISFCLYISARQSAGWQVYVSSHQDLYNNAVIFHAPVGAAAAICNGLFLQTIACSEFAGNAALWSLSNEFWYYVLFFALISVRKKPAYIAMIVTVFGLFALAEHHDTGGTHIGLKFIFFFFIWCLGVIAYAVVAPAWAWCCGFLLSMTGLYFLTLKGLFPQWASFSMSVGLGTAAFIVGADHLKVSLPSFLRAGRELAKFSFSLYAIHYPILLLLNVTVASDRQEFTLASIGLNASFILACLFTAAIFYCVFERRTPTIRDWLKAKMLRGWIDGPLLRPTVVVDAAALPYVLASDRATAPPAAAAAGAGPSLPSAASGMPLKQVERSRGHLAAVATRVPMALLNDGHVLPQLGFGAWQIDNAIAPEVITSAINAGYRLIDTAADYGNESGVGAALKRVRNQFYITTKLRNEDQGYDRTMRAFDASSARLQLDVVDLYLIHWPCPQRRAYVETWRALIELQKQGRVRSIGVSNFMADHLERIMHETGVVPAVNQVELHPAFQQRELRNIHERYGIVTQAWSPLGRGAALTNPRILAIAERCGCSPAQIVLRWHFENGTIAIPKSANAARMAENIDVFDFDLTSDDHAVISRLDRPDGRIGPDPATYGQMGLFRGLTRRLSRT